MVMQPVRGWEPWRRGRVKRRIKRIWQWVRHVDGCREGRHLRSAVRLRERHSRYSVVLEVCKRCDQVLDAAGQRER